MKPVIWWEVQRVDRRIPFVVGAIEVQYYRDRPGEYIIHSLSYTTYQEEEDEQATVVRELRASTS